MMRDEHEDAAEDEHLFRRAMPLLGGPFDDRARDGGGGGDLRVG